MVPIDQVKRKEHSVYTKSHENFRWVEASCGSSQKSPYLSNEIDEALQELLGRESLQGLPVIDDPCWDSVQNS